MSDWSRQLEERLRSMEGQILVGVEIEEMAFFDEGPDGFPLFEHPDLPFVQAQLISLAFQDGRFGFLHTHQNDDTFGIYFDWREEPLESLPRDDGELSIYRQMPNPGFPLGLVKQVNPSFDNKGDVKTLALKVDRSTVILCCGELEEGYDWSYTVKGQGESILVFADQETFEAVSFDVEATLSV